MEMKSIKPIEPNNKSVQKRWIIFGGIGIAILLAVVIIAINPFNIGSNNTVNNLSVPGGNDNLVYGPDGEVEDDLSDYTSLENLNIPLFESTNEKPLNIEAYLQLNPQHKISQFVLFSVNDFLVYRGENTNGFSEEPNNDELVKIFDESLDARRKNMDAAVLMVQEKLINNPKYTNVSLQNSPIIQSVNVNKENNQITIVTSYVFKAIYGSEQKSIVYLFGLETNQNGDVLDIIEEEIIAQ